MNSVNKSKGRGLHLVAISRLSLIKSHLPLIPVDLQCLFSVIFREVMSQNYNVLSTFLTLHCLLKIVVEVSRKIVFWGRKCFHHSLNGRKDRFLFKARYVLVASSEVHQGNGLSFDSCNSLQELPWWCICQKISNKYSKIFQILAEAGPVVNVWNFRVNDNVSI